MHWLYNLWSSSSVFSMFTELSPSIRMEKQLSYFVLVLFTFEEKTKEVKSIATARRPGDPGLKSRFIPRTFTTYSFKPLLCFGRHVQPLVTRLSGREVPRVPTLHLPSFVVNRCFFRRKFTWTRKFNWRRFFHYREDWWWGEDWEVRNLVTIIRICIVVFFYTNFHCCVSFC